jgi:DNA-binding MarR family transcriptional regulator
MDPVRERSHVAAPHDLIELIFFAYRDFVGEADLVLAAYGFGRAHHRVLHFVDRLPGLTIAELLDILRITKQSLNRVLRDLIEGGFVEQRAGVADRRRRLLVTTRSGEALARELARVQSARISQALAEAGENTRETVTRFLAGMIGASDRAHVLELVARGRINGPHS